jgi:hypothetical protein
MIGRAGSARPLLLPFKRWDRKMAEAKEAAPTLIEAETSGPKVHSRDGDNLGHVKALMVNKGSGEATYAILSLGGFLGMNKSYYPVPFIPSHSAFCATTPSRTATSLPSTAACSRAAQAGRTTRPSSTRPMPIAYRPIMARRRPGPPEEPRSGGRDGDRCNDSLPGTQ